MKRILAWLLVCALILGLCACGQKESAETKDGAGTTRTAATAEAADDPVEQEEEALREMDMTGKMESWRGSGGDGRVSVPGDWEATVLTAPEELARYRGYFPSLSNEDAARIIADEDGIVAVLEVASPDLTLNYGVNEVLREDGGIFFMVSAEPDESEPEYDENGDEIPREEPGSPFEYFLFYISGENYNDESLYFNFVN